MVSSEIRCKITKNFSYYQIFLQKNALHRKKTVFCKVELAKCKKNEKSSQNIWLFEKKHFFTLIYVLTHTRARAICYISIYL